MNEWNRIPNARKRSVGDNNLISLTSFCVYPTREWSILSTECKTISFFVGMDWSGEMCIIVRGIDGRVMDIVKVIVVMREGIFLNP